MKLKRVRIRNFRCFQNETTLDLEDITALVGRNDSGKSTVLDAIALFFDAYSADCDDACNTGNKEDMAVICEFNDLPAELIIDVNYKVIPSLEWLVNQRGNLEIHRIYNGAIQKPKRTRTFLVAQHPTASGFNDLLYLKNADLKTRAQSIGVNLDGVDQRVNSALRQAIWNSSNDLRIAETEIDIEKEDAKKIWIVLEKQLPLFAIFHSDRKSTDQDDEAQDPLKAAINEALQAHETALETLTQNVREQVLGIARSTVEKLREMDPNLAQELNPRFVKPNWNNVFKISLTDESQIPINKRGSGVRRLILLNFFRAEAEKRLANGDAPGIIYAIEEPETSQHPINQRILLAALRDLSAQPGCQVVFTSHTPVLVRDIPLSSLKYVTQYADGNRGIIQGDEDTYREIASALGVIPDHDIRLFIGVEGLNDINFLRSISTMLRNLGEDFLDLSMLENQGKIVFIPVGGSNLALWTHRLAGLHRPEFHLYDRDEEPPTRSLHQDAVDEINGRGAVAVLTQKRETENYLHPRAIQTALGVEINFGDFDDIPDLVAQQIHIAGGGIDPWNAIDPEKKSKKVSNAKKRLNTLAVAAMTPELLAISDRMDEIRGWLKEIHHLYES